MKKIVSLLLAVLFAFSVFCLVGCGKINDSSVAILWSGDGVATDPNSLINSMDRAMYIEKIAYEHYGAKGDAAEQVKQAKAALDAGCAALVVEPVTALDFIIQAADAISAARPGARREDVENYIKRLQKLEEVAGAFEGVDKTFAIQAGREVRIMVKPEAVNDDKMKLLARDIAKKIENELDYPGQIKVSVIRESRTVEYAK